MRFWLQIIDWEYPGTRRTPEPELCDVADKTDLMNLYLSLANGIIVEMRAESETEEGLDFLRGLLMGAGGCRRVVLTEGQRKQLWLCRHGDECYLQGRDGYIFVNPVPQQS